MTVSLPPELEQLVREMIESGRYGSADEVVDQALRLLSQRDQYWDLRGDEVRAKIAEGLASLQRGEKVEGEAVFARLEGELDRLDQPPPVPTTPLHRVG